MTFQPEELNLCWVMQSVWSHHFKDKHFVSIRFRIEQSYVVPSTTAVCITNLQSFLCLLVDVRTLLSVFMTDYRGEHTVEFSLKVCVHQYHCWFRSVDMADCLRLMFEVLCHKAMPSEYSRVLRATYIWTLLCSYWLQCIGSLKSNGFAVSLVDCWCECKSVCLAKPFCN